MEMVVLLLENPKILHLNMVISIHYLLKYLSILETLIYLNLLKITSSAGCGKVIKDTKQDRCRFFVTDSKDNQTKIIPILKKYSMLGFKQLNFQDFCKAADIIASKGHLTEEGIKKLDEIRGGMNDSRAWIKEK